MTQTFQGLRSLSAACASALVLSSCADLSGTLQCPPEVFPGQAIAQNAHVTLSNTGAAAADNFFVDLVLSRDKNIPLAFANYSPNFSEDVLLEGGREYVSKLDAGATQAVPLRGSNRIPNDTPEGQYFLGLAVDPGGSVNEHNRSNNTAVCPVKVTCPAAAEINDATILEASGGTVGFARMKIGWQYGNGEKPQALSITIFRLEAGDWHNIMPREQPFIVQDMNSNTADVIIYRLFWADYRIVFDANYACSRSQRFSFDRQIPNRFP